MYELIADNPKIAFELDEVIRLFFPDGEMSPSVIKQKSEIQNKRIFVYFDVDGKIFAFYDKFMAENKLDFTRDYNRFNKVCFYKVLSEITGKQLPWGSLTGVRPTKLAYEFIDNGKTVDEAVRVLHDTFGKCGKSKIDRTYFARAVRHCAP